MISNNKEIKIEINVKISFDLNVRTFVFVLCGRNKLQLENATALQKPKKTHARSYGNWHMAKGEWKKSVRT